MKTFIAKGFWFCRYMVLAGGITLMLGVCPLLAQEDNSGIHVPADTHALEVEAAAAWQKIDSASVRPNPPSEWSQNRPSEEAVKDWKAREHARLVTLADQARDFYTKFSKDTHVKDAKRKEWMALTIASRVFEDPTANKRIDAIETELLSDSTLSKKDRYGIRVAQIQRRARSGDQFEKGVRELLKEFPDEPQSYQMLLYAAKGADQEHNRAIAEEIIKSTAPEEVKEEAKGILKMADIVGKPLNLQFTSIEGQQVDLQKMKGKVVLVDFWATWCGPCVGEIPNVKAAYAKLHNKGFEIVGVSFDQDKAKLEAFLKEQEMTWPQYFDGKGWQNKIGQEFGIDSIPRMWLVDKKGLLRDLDGRDGLENKVEKLLLEP